MRKLIRCPLPYHIKTFLREYWISRSMSITHDFPLLELYKTRFSSPIMNLRKLIKDKDTELICSTPNIITH